jgi:hypothetical protein
MLVFGRCAKLGVARLLILQAFLDRLVATETAAATCAAALLYSIMLLY